MKRYLCRLSVDIAVRESQEIGDLEKLAIVIVLEIHPVTHTGHLCEG